MIDVLLRPAMAFDVTTPRILRQNFHRLQELFSPRGILLNFSPHSSAILPQCCRTAPGDLLPVSCRAMAKTQERTGPKRLKIKLSRESEALLDAAGVSLDDLARLLVFGRRRRTRGGVEILFDDPPSDDPSLARQLRPLAGLSLLVKDGCVIECRRNGPPPAKKRKKASQ